MDIVVGSIELHESIERWSRPEQRVQVDIYSVYSEESGLSERLIEGYGHSVIGISQVHSDCIESLSIVQVWERQGSICTWY